VANRLKPEEPIAVDDGTLEVAARVARSFRDFLPAIWPIVEPSTVFRANWHLDAIADHLEAVDRGQIRHLLITMPPRFTKSLTATIAFPTWVWTRKPHRRFLTASHNMGLSTEHAVLSRRIIESFWYQTHFGDRVQLTTDQNVKTHYENTARGYRMAMSVGGGVTGHGGDILICDDPIDVEDRFSEAIRKKAVEWRLKVWSSRLNDPKAGCTIDIMQRCHQKDVGAALIDLGNVEHLCLPQEYNPKKIVTTSLGFRDPRQHAGELMSPDRFGPAENAAARKTLGSDYNAIHNQEPQPEGGLLFKRPWFSKIITRDQADAMLKAGYVRGRGWDAAATEGDGDFTCGVKMAKTADGFYIVEHVIRGQWGPDEADKTMLATVRSDGRDCRQREEQEGGSSGKKVIAAHLKLLAGYDFKGETSTGDKATRARPFRAQLAGGNVYFVEGPWLQDYIDELCGFPAADHDDQVDASSNIFNDIALVEPKQTVAFIGTQTKRETGWQDKHFR
jgi:predicted phage terminase large subunit-like protein